MANYTEISMTKRKTDRVFPKSYYMSRLAQEEYCQAERIRTGKDPDEHTIYNVLCPAIRAKWSKREELNRRMSGRRLEMALQVFRDPEAFRSFRGIKVG